MGLLVLMLRGLAPEGACAFAGELTVELVLSDSGLLAESVFGSSLHQPESKRQCVCGGECARARACAILPAFRSYFLCDDAECDLVVLGEVLAHHGDGQQLAELHVQYIAALHTTRSQPGSEATQPTLGQGPSGAAPAGQGEVTLLPGSVPQRWHLLPDRLL